MAHSNVSILQPLAMSLLPNALTKTNAMGLENDAGIVDVGTFAVLRLVANVDHIAFDDIKRHALRDAASNFHFVSRSLDPPEIAARLIDMITSSDPPQWATIELLAQTLTGHKCPMRYDNGRVVLQVQDYSSDAAYGNVANTIALCRVSRVKADAWAVLTRPITREQPKRNRLETSPSQAFLAEVHKLRPDKSTEIPLLRHFLYDTSLPKGMKTAPYGADNCLGIALSTFLPNSQSVHVAAADLCDLQNVTFDDPAHLDRIARALRNIEQDRPSPPGFGGQVRDFEGDRDSMLAVAAKTMYDYTVHSTPLNIAIIRSLFVPRDPGMLKMVPMKSGDYDLKFNFMKSYAMYRDNVVASMDVLPRHLPQQRDAMVVYRGVQYMDLTGGARAAFHLRDLPFTIHNPTPCSTTIDPAIATGFAKPNGVMLALLVAPEDAQSVYVDSISPYDEKELVIAPGCRFQIYDVRVAVLNGQLQTVMVGKVLDKDSQLGGADDDELVDLELFQDHAARARIRQASPPGADLRHLYNDTHEALEAENEMAAFFEAYYNDGDDLQVFESAATALPDKVAFKAEPDDTERSWVLGVGTDQSAELEEPRVLGGGRSVATQVALVAVLLLAAVYG
jgi:hypothetical protein